MKILILGGTGFLSGTLARLALARGHQLWCITRGTGPLPAGANAVVADRRDNPSMERAVMATEVHWDLVVDCIGYEPEDAHQDILLFENRADHLLFISTDFVYSHLRPKLPVMEEGTDYQRTGYGGKKRLCEKVLFDSRPSDLGWTILRPTHIYGPGSLLGCLPRHSRDPELPKRIQNNSTLTLVGGGRFLQQPVHVRDLAELCLEISGKPQLHGQLFNVAGPDTVESREYYRILATLLETELTIKEASVADYLQKHPEQSPLLCHRTYDLRKLASAGLSVPSTTLQEGLAEHLRHLLEGGAGT
jgi:nucleoside-diphosphate-sugar epimerase